MGVQINGDTGNISATKADYSGNVTIGGTLTYEDVTNIDSVGLVTARSGLEIGARPGVAASISVDGNMIVSGISTFNSRVLLGTTTEGQADADNLTIADSGSCGITIRSGTSSAGSIYFSDATSGAAEYDGAFIYNQSSQFMAVYTAQTERLRIDSSGYLIAKADMRLRRTASDNGALYFGDTNNNYIFGSDADDVITFATAGNERLRIESDGDFRLSSGDAGTNYGYIRGWESSTGNMIIGADQSTTGSSGSNLIFRTRGGERARIIHGGGITFNGDTAAANALDDYEEGTWTPSIHNGGSPSYSQQAGLYTKIGNLVTHVFVIAYSGASSSSSTRIQGLPFAYSSTFETTTNLGRIGAAWNDAESAGSRALHAVGHTGTGTSMIYVDLLTSGTDKTLRGFFQMRV